MKSIKTLPKIIFFVLLFFLVFEVFSRTIIFFITKNKLIFEYGFNKTIFFKVNDLTELDFVLLGEKKNKNKNKKKFLNLSKEKLTIWAFGGSTTEGREPGCGHNTSSWVYELSKLNESILTVNFGKKGNSSEYSYNVLYEQFSKKKPDIILWANKHNEISNFLNTNKGLKTKSTIILFFERLDYTFKINSVFYVLFVDAIERSIFKIFGYQDLKQPKFEYFFDEENIKISKEIYKNNTIRAIKFAKYFNIDFHILSLFTKYEKIGDGFEYSFYNHWDQVAEELSKDHNIYYFKTEEAALETLLKNHKKTSSERVKFFCDNVHPTLLGNILTAKIINSYLIKTYNLK